MKIIEKQVTALELFDVINAVRAREGKKGVSWDGFLHSISLNFLRAPAIDLRWHDRTGTEDRVYILSHKALSDALVVKPL